MSILTKILAVLLSVFSLVLVGMVVSFVGNADNFKKLYEDQKSLNSSIQGDAIVKDEQYNTQVKKFSEMEAKRLQQIQTLEADNNRLASELQKAERLALQYQGQADSWKGVMTGFEQSVRNLQATLSETQDQLDRARKQGIKDQKELNEITAALHEKIVLLGAAEAERRRVLEKYKELEEQKATSVVREVIPVTPLNRTVKPASTSVPTSSDIKGLVAEVSANLVTLSIGSADGVREKMVFHVTRGERFLCDVIVTNVDINKSAGVLDLVQQPPQVGDTVSTQLY